MAYLGKTPSQAVRSRYYFTATGGETSLSGADDNSNTLTFTDGNYVDVSLNGATLVAGTDYNTTTANTIGGLAALVASDVVEVVVYDTFSVFSGAFTGDISLGDNVKAKFGASDDLQIYHDGSDSYIDDAGTGALAIRSNSINLQKYTGEAMAIFTADGSAELRWDNNTRLTTTTSGIDVTGTVTADDHIYIEGNAARLSFGENDTTDLNTRFSLQTGSFRVETVNNSFASAVNRITVDNSTGDISFYEDTGTTAKFFWDASTERLGIGTTSPARDLHIVQNDDWAQIRLEGNSSGGGEIMLGDGTTEAKGRIQYVNNANYMRFDTNATERMRIDSSGNVGIGTSSPAQLLHVQDGSSGNGVIRLGGSAGLEISHDNAGYTTQRIDSVYRTTTANANLQLRTGTLTFHTGTASTERMRLDSSGNLLVGKTGSSFGTAGTEIGSDRVWITRSDAEPLTLNRLTSDGDILDFAKDGTTVGSIRSRAGNGICLDSKTGYAGVLGQGGTNYYYWNNERFRPVADNARDLGENNGRWQDLYLSGGVIFGSGGTSKKLDDYEEGTHNVTDLSGAGLSITTNRSFYVKTGSIVNFHVSINVPSNSNSNTLQLSLPFSSNIGSYFAGTGAVGYSSVSSSSYPDISPMVDNFGARIIFYYGNGSNFTNAAASGHRIDFWVQWQRT